MFNHKPYNNKKPKQKNPKYSPTKKTPITTKQPNHGTKQNKTKNPKQNPSFILNWKANSLLWSKPECSKSSVDNLSHSVGRCSLFSSHLASSTALHVQYHAFVKSHLTVLLEFTAAPPQWAHLQRPLLQCSSHPCPSFPKLSLLWPHHWAQLYQQTHCFMMCVWSPWQPCNIPL